MTTGYNAEAARRKLEWDLARLQGMVLNRAYPREYRSWDNMKQRARAERCTVAPEFETFPGFLKGMGRPMPPGKHTSDRLDNDVRVYGPGLCDWRTPKEQANNRSTTHKLTIDGKTAPLTSWAEETGQRPDTLRKRLARGWSHQEVVYGKQAIPVKKVMWPGFQDDWIEWERAYSRRPERDAYQTRLQFFAYRQRAKLAMETNAVVELSALASFLESGQKPPSHRHVDMDAWYATEFEGVEPAELRARLCTLEATCGGLRAELNEAEQMAAAGQDSNDLARRMKPSRG